jgi:hypothetical protein
MTLVPLSIYFNAAAAPRSSWRWPRARTRPTSARRSRNATGSASKARIMRDEAARLRNICSWAAREIGEAFDRERDAVGADAHDSGVKLGADMAA